MSDPDQLAAGADKVYQFISDPGHKENLSGRVRAACLTCRRKKIKCSGEPNCRTCREKGLVCEGLPERRRAKKGAHSTTPLDVDAARNEAASPDTNSSASPSWSSSRRPSEINSVRRLNSRRESMPLPVTDFVTRDTTSSVDSGYASGNQSPPFSRMESRLSINSALATYDLPTDVSPGAGALADWSFAIGQRSSRNPQPENAGSEASCNTHIASVPPSRDSRDWRDPTDLGTWWPNNFPQNSNNASDSSGLLSAAQVLEAQAQSLRRMASANAEMNDDARRQTIAVPTNHSDQPPAWLPHVQNAGALDDLALLFSERSTGTNMTPLTGEYNPWWDVDANLGCALRMHQSTTHPYQTTIQSPMASSNDQTGFWTSEYRDVSSEAIGAKRHVDARDSRVAQNRNGQSSVLPNLYDPACEWPK